MLLITVMKQPLYVRPVSLFTVKRLIQAGYPLVVMPALRRAYAHQVSLQKMRELEKQGFAVVIL
jgi:hypothetical protein